MLFPVPFCLLAVGCWLRLASCFLHSEAFWLRWQGIVRISSVFKHTTMYFESMLPLKTDYGLKVGVVSGGKSRVGILVFAFSLPKSIWKLTPRRQYLCLPRVFTVPVIHLHAETGSYYFHVSTRSRIRRGNLSLNI